MKNSARATEVGWLPLKDSYEEAVLNWYEQIETSFRRRRLEAHRANGERTAAREAVAETGQVAFD